MGVTRIGSTTHFVARYALKQFGLRPDTNVTFFQTGGQPELFAALEGGSVQSAILNAGPFTVPGAERRLCPARGTSPPWGGHTSTEAWPLVSLLSEAGLT